MIDNRADYDRVVAWRDAAIADGWMSRATYQHEPESSACTLERELWVAQLLTRTHAPGDGIWPHNRRVYETAISVWGPDELAVHPGDTYNWPALQAGLRTCQECGATDVTTHRVGFAGRCCTECLPLARKKYEYPGWTD